MSKTRVSIFHSLKTQLFGGALLLLGITVGAVGYALIVQQERALTGAMERAVILQGRNLALSSVKPLLRSDPEFELYPLVTHVIEEARQVRSVVVVDAEGTIQGHPDLVMVHKEHSPALDGFLPVKSPLLGPGENLYAREDAYLFVTPVVGADRPVGTVYLTYSREDLVAGIQRAVNTTLKLSAAAVLVGLLLSLLFFRHISRPMRVMLEGVDAVGGGDLDARIEMPTRNEFRVLASAFNDMSERLSRSRGELVAKERMDRELEIAADIQEALIPQSVTPPKGYEISHFYRSATEVGGDYVDVIPVANGEYGFVMADVAGKGVPGLIVMAMVKILAQQLIQTGTGPSEVLKRINSALRQNMRRNMFVTMFVGMMDPEKRRIVFSNAGHNPLLIYGAESHLARFFKMDGVPLGAFPAASFDRTVRDYQIMLEPGDLILQYTDGLNEARTSGGRMFGMDRIRDLTTLYSKYGAPTVVEKLVAEVERFRDGAEQSDDITILAVGAVASSRETLEDPVIS
jgi:sigma-B regulation protein RsbU (phosphoserine phosphatase)